MLGRRILMGFLLLGSVDCAELALDGLNCGTHPGGRPIETELMKVWKFVDEVTGEECGPPKPGGTCKKVAVLNPDGTHATTHVCSSSCFHATTKFMTRTGPKQVSLLEIGDEIQVWDPSKAMAVYSRILAWLIRPLTGEVPTSCDSSKNPFLQFHYTTAAGQEADFAVTPSHYVEIKCRPEGQWANYNSAERRKVSDGPTILPGYCVVPAHLVEEGDLVPIWDDAKQAYAGASISKIVEVVGGDPYTPFTEMGADFVLSGGAIVPLDSMAPIPATANTLAFGAIPRIFVRSLLTGGQQFYIAVRSIMPASWMAQYEATLLATEPLQTNECLDTPRFINLGMTAMSSSKPFIDSMRMPFSANEDASVYEKKMLSFLANNLCELGPMAALCGVDDGEAKVSVRQMEVTSQQSTILVNATQSTFSWVEQGPAEGSGVTELRLFGTGASAGLGIGAIAVIAAGGVAAVVLIIICFFIKKGRKAPARIHIKADGGPAAGTTG